MQKNENLNTLFDIQSGKEISREHKLLLEAGSDYCCYAFWNSATQTFDALRYISFPETEAEETLSKIVTELGSYRFQSVFVCSAFPQAILTPSKYFHDNYEALDVIYDEPSPAYKHDRITDWHMVNIYSMPSVFRDQMQQTFSSVQYLHAYTTAIKLYNGYLADNQLSVHFTPNHLRVLLKKDSAIQLAQTYFYATPLDVIYYLLKICYEFELDQASVSIILSGLVEKASNLYAELEQYFINIHFAQATDIKLPGDSYPHYFFTSLFNLATCVSSVEA